MKRALVFVVSVMLVAAGVSIAMRLRHPRQPPADPDGLPEVFQSDSPGFSIRYPSGWTVDTAYRYQALGPGKDIAGVSFTVPASLAEGTNLSGDSYLSVEAMPGTDRCTADLFLPSITEPAVEPPIGTPSSIGRWNEAAMGNRYDETVYAIPGSDPCLAVRYFIHWTIIENYPPGVVTAFARSTLLDRLDAMRRTLVRPVTR